MILALTAAAAPPNVDDPVRTGATAATDAALVIGIEDYATAYPDVPWAQRDAEAFRDLLVATRGVPVSRVRTLTGQPSRGLILATAREVGALAGSGGTVWVYFAGHGLADPRSGERLLLPANAATDVHGVAEDGVKVTELTALLGAGGADVVSVVDACYTGNGRGGAQLFPGSRFAVPTWTQHGTDSSWSATSGSGIAHPFDPARHGAFTYAVLGALRGWADGAISGTPDGEVTEDEVQFYVVSVLRGMGINDQTPEFTGAGTRRLVTGTNLERAPASWTTPSAPSPDAPSRSAPSRTPYGIRGGMTRAEVDHLFGAGTPGGANSALQNVTYPQASVWFRLADGKVDQVNVTTPEQAAFGADDPVARWFGRSYQEVVQAFGPSQTAGTDNVSYPLEGGQLAFWFREGRCYSISRFYFP